jgi:organic hydroperoxide reductase OsmC/OhrA
MAGFWSPEDMLVGAAASCFALTLVSACAARSIRLYSLRVKGVGHVGTRADSRYGFEGLELRVNARVPEEDRDDMRALVQKVSRGCIVGTALELPLHVELDLEEAAPASRSRKLMAEKATAR